MEIKNHVTKVIKINSFETFIHEIQKLEDFVKEQLETGMLLFRGQENAEWSLLPKLGRVSYHKAGNEIAANETEMFSDFRRRALPYLPPNFNKQSDWDWLALAQHFKLPTRLLDWTENPLVALFFAIQSTSELKKPFAVWAFAVDRSDFLDAAAKISPFDINTTKSLFLIISLRE
jgi:type I restriction enzyme M protein